MFLLIENRASRFIFATFYRKHDGVFSDFEPDAETTDWDHTAGSWTMLEDDLGRKKPKLFI